MVENAHSSLQSEPGQDVAPDALLRLLLDMERLAILGAVAQDALTLDELSKRVSQKRATLLRNVEALLAAGLVRSGADERLRLDAARIQGMKRTLFARSLAPEAARDDGDVVAKYVRDGKLLQWPAPNQEARRRVLLGWLAERFEFERDYRESEVNELLRGHSLDHATLRRYLVDAGHLTRGGGIYRRATPIAQV